MEKLKDRCMKNSNNDTILEQNMSTYDVDDDATLIEDELEAVIRTAICYFKEYGASKGLSLHSISQMPPIQLADYLKDFYSTCKPHEGKNLTRSLKYLRTGLQKYFQKNQGIDIIYDSEFDGANRIIEPHGKQFPRRGQRLTALRIEYDDLKKIYLGPAMNLEQPDTLQNKVFFDVNVYICNRGKDFLRVMSKSDFDVAVDSDGRKYVWLKYHSKFSFKELVGGLNDNDPVICANQIGERMYERIGDPKCPVASFVQYISHLHPMTDAFWQRPKRNFVATDYVWYDNTPLGNSTISKIMTRTCQMSGLFENYTNHTIKSSYIHMIEKICSDALKESKLFESHKACASPVITSRQQLSVDESSVTEVSSVTSDSRDKETENCDDEKVGLRQAKMKVLEMVHGLEVRDIRSFVEWLKTFRVEYDGGGLMVMCSPVDQKLEQKEEKKVEEREKSSISNGEKRREVSPTPPLRNRLLSPAPQFFRNQSSYERDHLKLLSRHESLEKIPEAKTCDFGIAIRQLEFETVSDVSCSASDISPIKVTVPTQNTVLLTGLQDSVQLLLHNREGPPMSSEPLHSRIFYSQHEMDVAVVTALLSTRNSLKSTSCATEKIDNSCKLQDKFKPVKKRSLTDIHAGFAHDDFEIPAKKQFIPTSNPGTFVEYTPRYNNSSQNKPTSIYHVPVTARSNLPVLEQSSGSAPMPIQDNSPSLVVNYHNKSPTAGMNLMYQIKVKKEPTDLE